MGKYASDAHVLGTCIKYCTNASPLGADGTYVWRPNITGGSAVRRTNSGESTFWAGYGAFSDTSTTGTTNLLSVSGMGNWGGTSFDASNSNNIYTDNGHVYPLSLALNYIIKA